MCGIRKTSTLRSGELAFATGSDLANSSDAAGPATGLAAELATELAAGLATDATGCDFGNDSGAGSVNRSSVRAVANAEVISCLTPSICAMSALRPYSLALEWCVQDFAVTGADDPDGLPGTVAVVVVVSSGAKRK
jgi:hypothetical protein